MKVCQAVLTYGADTKIVNTKGNKSKSRKTDLRFMCSACRLMVFNICVKFHENLLSNFKLM